MSGLSMVHLWHHRSSPSASSRFFPSSFLPEEDQGYFITVVQLPDGASKQRTDAVVSKLEKYFLSIPSIHDRCVGRSEFRLRHARVQYRHDVSRRLHLWDQRKGPDQHVKALIGGAFAEFAKIPEALIVAFNAPSIRGLGATGGFSAQVQDPSGGDFKKFAAVTQEFLAKARQEPAIGAISTSFRVSSPRIYAHVDRERAKSLGVPISEVFDTLQAFWGNLYINDFVKFGRVYRVQTEAEPQYRSTTRGHFQDLRALSAYERPGTVHDPARYGRDNRIHQRTGSGDPFQWIQYGAGIGSGCTGIQFRPGAGGARSRGLQALTPKGFALDYSGISYQEHQVSGQSIFAFGFGLLMVFLVLAAQYESWSVPFAVILAVPFGVFGALTAVWVSGQANDIYFQIGLVTLIGLSAKNAILIVEFAKRRYEHGMPAIDAAIEAARLRFRPIIMTSMAFIGGVVPLVIATGAGPPAGIRSVSASSAGCWRRRSWRSSSCRCSSCLVRKIESGPGAGRKRQDHQRPRRHMLIRSWIPMEEREMAILVAILAILLTSCAVRP